MSEVLPLESLSKSKRLNILTPTEIDDLYAQPQLTEDERCWLFELSQEEGKILSLNLSIAAKVDTIIRLGYFKRKQQFYQFELTEIPEDVNHIITRYFSPLTLDKNTLGRETKLRNQQWILRTTGYHLFSQSKHFSLLLNKAESLCRTSVNPVFIFRELLIEITNQKITRPGYSTMQKIISCALVAEQNRIKHILKAQLTLVEKAQLFKLLEQEENFYEVTLLKNQPQNFKPTAIRQEIAYYEKYQHLYLIAKKILPLLEISKNGVIYYASLVEHYTVQSLSRINSDQTCLWLLCFIYHRCRRMIDNMATMFIYVANQYQNDVKAHANALLLIDALSPDEKKKMVARLVRVFTDKTINENDPFKIIKNMVYTNISSADRIDRLANEFDNQDQAKLYQLKFIWEAIDEFASTHRPILRSLLKVLSFEEAQRKSLQKAYQFLRNALMRETPLSQIPADQFPLKFIDKKDRDFIYDKEKKTIQTDRYEYACYTQIALYLNGRSTFLCDSINYQSLAAELLPNWDKPEVKQKILRQVNKPLLNEELRQFIEEKAKPLDGKILAINENISNGKNFYVKLKQDKQGDTIWTLPYTKKSLELNNPFYAKLPPVSIASIIQFVNDRTNFMRQFTHIKPHYAKSQIDEIAICACLIANGTNLGITKMASLCDLNLENLQRAEKNYLRLATLRAANDEVSNAIAKLPIFRHWNLQPDILHASLDGQKFITEWDNILSRYSRKYFGGDKGVVAYSLIANHVPINTMIIGANEHESRFFFDLIYNNTSEIKPDVFSTDTEGSNKLNFLLLHLIERLYAPALSIIRR